MKAKQISRVGQIFADGRRIDEALRLAARDAIRKHEQHNAPVVVWRDGSTAHPRKTAGQTRELGLQATCGLNPVTQFAGLPPAFLPRQRVQDIDRVADVQAFPEPTWRDGVRVQDEPLRIVQRP